MRLLVFRDVGVHEEKLPAYFIGVGFVDARLSGAERLDLGSGQYNTSLDGFLDEIIMPRPPILSGHAARFVARLGHNRTIS